MFLKKGIPEGSSLNEAGPMQIQITQEQMTQIQNLVANPAFELLREQASTNPQILPQLLQMLRNNYPSLFELFSQNPQLLVALLSGGLGTGSNEESEGSVISNNEAGAVDLTEEDEKNIKTVGS